MSIREKLGLAPKNPEAEPKVLVDDTREAPAPAHDLSAELAALDDLMNEELEQADSVQKAQAHLAAFELTPGAASLLDRAMDSLSKNTGAGLNDPDAVAIAKGRAALIRAAGGQLSVVIDATVEVTPPLEVGGAVYSLLYAVLKNALFFANLDRNAARGFDMASDDQVVEDFFARMVGDRYVTEALGHVVGDLELDNDDRNDQSAPVGFETRREAQLRALAQIYGHVGRDSYGGRQYLAGYDISAEDAVVEALRDLRLFFQLTCEAMGWDVERPMPFMNTQNPDQSFTPIHDAETALDATEIKRVASQVRRREVQAQRATAATAAAQAIMRKALEGSRNHLIKK